MPRSVTFSYVDTYIFPSGVRYGVVWVQVRKTCVFRRDWVACSEYNR